MRRLTTFVFLPDAYNYILGTQDAYNVQMFIIISSLGIGFVVKLLTTKHRCFLFVLSDKNSENYDECHSQLHVECTFSSFIGYLFSDRPKNIEMMRFC